MQKHQTSRTVSFFFCTRTADKTLGRRNIVGSLACQVLRHEIIIPSLVTFLDARSEPPDALASMDYIDLLLKITPKDWQGIFILDGLDELPLDEVEELFLDLQHLMQSRNVLLCCSARTDSMCKPTVEVVMPVQSTISMDAEDRLADFEAYISAEVERWKTIRPLSSEIEQLIIKQLLVGSQGMFLWLALQMEAMCSRHTQELCSDSSIVSILENLPRSLPEAFDQALLRISDVRYGSRALQLVAVADPPLSSDELRVAVSVEPGNLAWTSSTILGSGRSLAFQYGGSLLEIDEEDLCVRLIHHSVFLHLTKPPALHAAAPFHFDLSDAEINLAEICVTYLSYGIFENQLRKGQNIALGDILDRVQDSVLKPNTITQKAWSIVSRSGRRTNSANIDVERLLHELRSHQSKVSDEIYFFLEYATKHWLDLTKCLPKPLQPAVHTLWTRLVDGIAGSTLEALPWTPRCPASATTWAICNQHKSLLKHQLCNPSASKRTEAANSTMSVLRDRSKLEQGMFAKMSWSPDPPLCLSGEELGNLAPTYLRSAYARGDLHVKDVAILVSIGCLTWAGGSSYEYFDDPLSAEADLDAIAQKLIPKVLLLCPGPIYVSCAMFLAYYLQDINETLANDLTLLEEFIRYRLDEPALFLLQERNADPNGPRRPGIPSPLQLCLRNRLYDIATLLIGRGADVMDDPDSGLPPVLVIIGDQKMSLFHRTMAMYCRQKNRRYGKRKETAFQFACRNHDAPGLSSIHSFTILNNLLDNGADLNSADGQGHTPLVSSIMRNKPSLFQWLLEAGADPNAPRLGATLPLHVATGDDIQALIEAGAHVNPRNEYEITPLMVASFCGDRVGVEALIGAGASVKSSIPKPVHGKLLDKTRAILSKHFVDEDGSALSAEGKNRLEGPAQFVEPADTAPMLVIRRLEFLQLEKGLSSNDRFSDFLINHGGHKETQFNTILSSLSQVASGNLQKELREYVQRYKNTPFGWSLKGALGGF